ncbi:serine hydrolase domain-containing protein [Qipengyuania vesicularis]|uniref:serine hydrolase domain-containing protein n=1 Tax=Qipengyuania vesicularis TaxID=2867232 RepID=UPI001C86F714|nr:serine hydrolase domain-containing protein [Qipengyuania vesicularis]MBX7528051.1 beta-lactamase family protein [Qipengyuania vesicularis]
MFRSLFALALAASAVPATASEFSFAELTSGRVSLSSELPGAAYEAGSISKFACTIAILRLTDKGLLDLDDPIGSILPQLRESAVASVRLRDVLANRSGIADGLLPRLRSAPEEVSRVDSAEDGVLAFASELSPVEPGSRWSYDLVNWIIVQAILEKVSGRPLTQALPELVLLPAGMGSSWVIGASDDRILVTPSEAGRPLPSFLRCAGGLATTPVDLLALARFPHQGGLSPRSVSALTAITTSEESYSLGGRFRAIRNSPVLSWQTGSNGAYKSLVVYDPVHDAGFAAMTASGENEPIQQARSEWLARYPSE